VDDCGKPADHDVLDALLVEERTDPYRIEHQADEGSPADTLTSRACACTAVMMFAASTITRTRSRTVRRNCLRI
jgi:hypothetical protein